MKKYSNNEIKEFGKQNIQIEALEKVLGIIFREFQ